MKKKISLFLITVLIILAFSPLVFHLAPKYEQSERTGFALDTVTRIIAIGKDAGEATALAEAEVLRIDRLFNAHKSDSEIGRINAASGEWVEVKKEVFDLITLSKEISQKTDGAFDITLKPLSDLWNIKAENPKVPSDDEINSAKKLIGFENIELNSEKSAVKIPKNFAIDLGAAAKGYAADKTAEVLLEKGIKNALIDLGGNIYAMGKNKGKAWTIGLQTPFKTRGEYFKKLEVKDMAVVTSGGYERYFEKDKKIYHHILDPKTGRPSESKIQSVTVVHKNSAVADALSTAIFVLGEEKAESLKKEFEIEKLVVVGEDGKVREY